MKVTITLPSDAGVRLVRAFDGDRTALQEALPLFPLAGLKAVLSGEVPLPEDLATSGAGQTLLQWVRDAIEELPAAHREFLFLDLVETLPSDEIQRQLGLATRSQYVSRKRQAFEALRDQLRIQMTDSRPREHAGNPLGPIQLANEAIQRLGARFNMAGSESLGAELLKAIQGDLAAQELRDKDDAWEVFDQLIVDAFSHLERHGGSAIRQPRAWLHQIRRRATERYLRNRAHEKRAGGVPLEVALEGGAQLPDEIPPDTLERVREIILSLPARHRDFLRLDVVESLPTEEIQRRLGIRTPATFRKRRSQAMKALREAILERG